MMCMRVSDYRLQWLEMRHRAVLHVVTVALWLAGCAQSPAPVTAERILDVGGIQPVVNAVALSPDGSVVAVGDMDGELVMRELPSGAERWRGRIAAGRVDGLVFSADGSLLASTAQQGRTFEVWQVLAGRQAAVLEIRDGRTAAFHPTEPALVVGSLGALHIVDTQRGEITRTLPNVHGGENIYAAAFSSDGRILATASDQGVIKVWTWPALTLRASVSMSKSLEPMAPVSLVLARQGTRAAANGLLGRVHIVDLAKEREERIVDNTPEAPGHGMHAEMRRSLEFSQDGGWLFAPDMHDRGVRILDLANGTTYPVFTGAAPFYKAMSISVPASLVALLRPGDVQGRGPYGLEVWRLSYRGR
jgi:WD domain, G-beta repeat